MELTNGHNEFEAAAGGLVLHQVKGGTVCSHVQTLGLREPPPDRGMCTYIEGSVQINDAWISFPPCLGLTTQRYSWSAQRQENLACMKLVQENYVIAS